MSFGDEILHYGLVMVNNLVLISHAIPSSIYIALEVIRFTRKRIVSKDLMINNRGSITNLVLSRAQ